MQQQEINDKLKDLVGDQEDEDVDVIFMIIQDMLNELMGEIKQEKKNKIEASKNVTVNVPQKNVQKQSSVK